MNQTMGETLQHFVDELLACEDEFERYNCLLEYAMNHPEMSDEAKRAAKLVDGCMSQVWVKVVHEGDKRRFELDSDTLIVRGILHVLEEVYSGHTVPEIESFDFTLLDDAGLRDLFSSERQTGFKSILALMVQLSQEELDESELLEEKAVEQMRDPGCTLCAFESALRSFILSRYGLEQTETENDFSELGKKSIQAMLKAKDAPAKLGKPSMSCRGASSADTKRVLLIVVVQKKLGVRVDPDVSVNLKTIPLLAAELHRLVAEASGGVE